MDGPARDVVTRLYREVWSEGRLDRADALCAPGFVGHAPGRLDFAGAAGLKELVAGFRAAFPDLELEVRSQFGAGTTVVTEHAMRGTQRGRFMGVPPTGRRIDLSGTSIVRVSGGVAAEAWYEWDRRRLLEQLDVMPTVV